ncbi:MAG: VOC family protein, partial [Bacteroidota bacterium]
MHTLDHLVYAVPDLQQAVDWFEANTGLRPAIGGRHLHQGTHNAVVNLGKGAYLEVVAPDPDNTSIPPPRWMGVDLITKPRMVRWSLKSNDLAQDAQRLQAVNPALGTIHTGQRKLTTGDLLRWQMTLPLSTPAIDLIPFFLDWTASDFHPTDRMPDQFDCMQIELRHPHPESMVKAL